MADPRDKLTIGTHLPRAVRRRNLALVRQAKAQERRAMRPAARAFWERCWHALLLEFEVWEAEPGRHVFDRPTQAAADAIMDAVGALPMDVQAKYAPAPDAELRQFMAALVQRWRRGPDAQTGTPSPEQGGEA